MRQFLLIFLMCLLPLQSFAAVSARLQMNRNDMLMHHVVEQGEMPCHEGAANTTEEQHGGCCKSTATCEFVCGLSAAVFSDAVTLHIPTATEFHFASLQTTYLSAHPEQPVKPPIF